MEKSATRSLHGLHPTASPITDRGYETPAALSLFLMVAGYGAQGDAKVAVFRMLVLLLLPLALFACGDDDAEERPPETLRVTVESADENRSVEVRIEIAATQSERERGLSRRDHLDEDAGMLFLFDGEPTTTPFWMKDTRIPLDIAFLGPDGTIQQIHRGEPYSEELLRPDMPYWFALEVNAGWFERNGFGLGDKVRIPAEVPAARVSGSS